VVATTTKKKVLVVDDDSDNLRIINMLLTRHGLTVVTAEDGEEGFQKARAEKPDAILLDITLPGMDGFALCAKLKAEEKTAAIPVGFLTARTDVESFKQAQQQGGLLYITKPFKPERLVNLVHVLLSALPATPGES
jgi:two-component system sensor histidine kinase/response regulator